MTTPRWTRSRLLAAGGSGMLRFVLSAPAYFVSVPILLFLLGRTSYGIWVLITTLTGWLFFSDLGLRTVVVREASLAAARSDFERLDRRLGVVTMLYVAITLGLIVLCALGLQPIVSFVLKIAVAYRQTATLVLAFGAMAFCLDLVGLGLFRGVSDGIGHVASNNLLAIGYSWGRTILILLVAWATRNVVWMAVASATASAVGLCIWRYTAWRAAPQLKYRPRLPVKGELREIVGFAGLVQVNDAVAAATPQLIEAVVVRRFGLSSLGLFDVGVQLYIHIRSMSFASWFPVMPWLSSREAERDDVGATAKRLTTSATLAGAVVASVAGIALAPCIAAWLPAATSTEVSTIVTLVTVGAVVGTSAPAFYACNACLKPQRTTVVLTVFLIVWLIPTVFVSSSLIEVARMGVAAALAGVFAANSLMGRARFGSGRMVAFCLLAGAALVVAAGPVIGISAQLVLCVCFAVASGAALGMDARSWLVGEPDAA